MSRPEHDDLIQGEIDGVNSAAESARLKDLLASRPDLDARLGSLRRVSETLGQAERLDPPPGFVDGVMSAVRRRKPEKEARTGWLEVLRSLLTPAPLAACACTLLLGVVLGGLLPSELRALLAVGAGGPLGHGARPRPAGQPPGPSTGGRSPAKALRERRLRESKRGSSSSTWSSTRRAPST